MTCKVGKIPCWGGKEFVDTQHDVVYELNKQMCNLVRTFSDPLDPPSEGVMQEFDRILTKNDKDMKENKTIQEWKILFAEMYKEMYKEIGCCGLDVCIYQNDVKPIVNFDIKF